MHAGNTSRKPDFAGKVKDCNGYSGCFRGNDRVFFDRVHCWVLQYAERGNMAVLHRQERVNTDKITRDYGKKRGMGGN